MKEIRNKKIINGLIGFILFLVILFGGFWLINNIFTIEVKAQTNENLDYSDKNLGVFDLVGKEYLGNGVYRVLETPTFTVDYDIINGTITPSGQPTNLVVIPFINNYTNNLDLTYSITNNGTTSGNFYLSFKEGVDFNGNIQVWETKTFTSNVNNTNNIIVFLPDTFYDGVNYMIQLEKSNTATDYTVPLQPYLWHEKQLSYEDGSENGYWIGYDDGYDNGYNHGFLIGRDYGYDIGYELGIQQTDGFNDGYDYGYDDARTEYGEFFPPFENQYGLDGWYGFQDGFDLGVDIGFNDGLKEGRKEVPNGNMLDLIRTVLLGVGTVLGIELLPNITIGAIILVPIVFGLIAFVLGRKKE